MTATVAAVAAGTVLTFAGAETSGAFAQESESASESTELTEEVMPVFVAKPVVQPIPAEDDLSDEPSTRSDSLAADEIPSATTLHALVSVTPTDGALSEELHCLAGAVYFESRGEPLTGQLAVAQVIINRSESRQFPASYCGVVHQRSQFSFVKNGRMPSIRQGSSAWQRAKAIARIAHQGMWESEADDSLYFHANYVRPSWSRSKQARARINTHIFYR
ncbi:cell wall hydrolase [Erythrobacter sp. QSSC1-22B]|uniref:cell wall hydrolase n=1 Tax=Erythrobacter sp. QSSC1-22B TaxID=1860125 RepID=UPI001F2C5647|nr:cell wall hydrolase [Erythrobacter sp. QSSC1-22B]